MGKFSKGKKVNRRIPFYKEIMKSNIPKETCRIKMRNHRETHETEIIDSKFTQKILTEAKRQLEDMEEEFELGSLCKDFQTSHLFVGLPEGKNTNEVSEKENFPPDTFWEEIESYQNSVPGDVDKNKILVDLLREKITEKRTEIHTIFSDVGNMGEQCEKIISIFKNAALLLSKYSSGPMPKPFKALPKLQHWEQLLFLTEPDNWTAAAMFQATRLFSSNLNSEMAQRFYNLILLPRIRDEIAQCQKLSSHLYLAVQKALYKPRAFFRGIIIPLCESGNCTKREAKILSSILSCCSIPVIHSSIALLLISQKTFSPTNCLFMKAIIEKKYSLYIPIIDALVDYFLKSAGDDKCLPEVWHQCLLSFVRIYKSEFSADQKQGLLQLLKVQNHCKISVVISKELLGTVCQNS